MSEIFICGECGRHSTKSSTSEVCVTCESEYQRGRADPEWAFNSDPEDLSNLSIFDRGGLKRFSTVTSTRRPNFSRRHCNEQGCEEAICSKFRLEVEIEDIEASDQIIGEVILSEIRRYISSVGPVCQSHLDQHIQSKVADESIQQMIIGRLAKKDLESMR